MSASDNFQPEKPPLSRTDGEPDKPAAATEAADNAAAANLSLAQIFSGNGKPADYKPFLNENVTIPFNRALEKTGASSKSGLPGIGPSILTKELSRELKSPNADSGNATTFKTFFVPFGKFVNAQGLEQRPFMQARKSEFKPSDEKKHKPVKTADASSSQVEIEGDEADLGNRKPDEARLPHSEPDDDLEVANIYTELQKPQEEMLFQKQEEQEKEDERALQAPLLDEMERVHPHDTAYVVGASLSKSRLLRCVENFSLGRVLIVGDLVIDELLEGKPVRISREAPVLILEHVATDLIPGGAANTANNVVALGGRSHAVGVCGKDDYAEKLATMLEKCKIDYTLIADPARPTTVKTRILSKSHSFKQQLLRLDRIAHGTIDSATATVLAQKLEPLASQYQGLILSDYRAGVITDKVIEACRQLATAHNLLLVVDAQDGFERFQEVDVITPNQPDAEAAVGYEFDSPERLIEGGDDLLLLTGAKALLVTRGAHGLALFRSGQKPFYLPPFNRSEVFDVTGAGDTMVATLTLALVTGASMEEAVALGNLAAGIVVRKLGTSVTTQKEMRETLEQLKLTDN